MKDKLLKIIDHYGINNQQRKYAEEVFELQEAITIAENQRFEGKYNGIPENTKENIKEEIADCVVLLRQFANYYKLDESEINDIVQFKVNRQLKRMENESNGI